MRMSVVRDEDGTPKCSVRVVGGNGKMVDAFVGDVVRMKKGGNSTCSAKAYVGGFTDSRIKVVCRGKIGYYLPKNLVFVERGRRDGTVPAEPYGGGRYLPEVVSVPGDDESMEVVAEPTPATTAEFVSYLEELSNKSCEMAKASVEFAVLMERGRARFSNGWAFVEGLEKVKEVATAEMEKRLAGFEAYVRDEMMAACAKKGKK